MRFGFFCGILGNASGCILTSLNGYHVLFSSVVGAKAMTIYEGLCLASKMDIFDIMILSNSLTMNQILQGTLEPLLEVANQVTDIKNI